MIGSAAKPPRILSSSDPQILHPSDSSRDSSRTLRKRKRSDSDHGEHIWRAEDVIGDGHAPDNEDHLIGPRRKKSEVPITGVRPPSFVCPKTAYLGHVPSMPRYSEKSVLRDILVGSMGADSAHTLHAKIVGRSKRRNTATATRIQMAMLSSKQTFATSSSTVPTSLSVETRAAQQNIPSQMNLYL